MLILVFKMYVLNCETYNLASTLNRKTWNGIILKCVSKKYGVGLLRRLNISCSTVLLVTASNYPAVSMAFYLWPRNYWKNSHWSLITAGLLVSPDDKLW
jgi:hypothetical protein